MEPPRRNNGKQTPARAAYKARRRSIKDVIAGMAIGRGNHDILSQEFIARILSDLAQKGWAQASEVIEESAEPGPKESYSDRLGREREAFVADILLGVFRRQGVLVDSRARSRRPLTSTLFSTLKAHEADNGRQLLDQCWISGEARRSWLRGRTHDGPHRRTNEGTVRMPYLAASPSPGRRKGQGSYDADDMPLVEEMRELVRGGLSVHAAALGLVGKARGAGSPESKVSRLERRYRTAARTKEI